MLRKPTATAITATIQNERKAEIAIEESDENCDPEPEWSEQVTWKSEPKCLEPKWLKG